CSFMSSTRVSASEDNVGDVRDVPASTLNVPSVGIRLATAVAVTPLACTVKDVSADPSNAVLNGTSANSPPLVPPATQSDVAPSPVRTWRGRGGWGCRVGARGCDGQDQRAHYGSAASGRDSREHQALHFLGVSRCCS